MSWWNSLIFNNEVWRYALFLLIILVFLLIGKLLTWFIKNLLKATAYKTKTKIDDLLLNIFEGPILLSIFIFALYSTKLVLKLSKNFLDKYLLFLSVLIIINGAWYAIRFFNALIIIYLEPLAKRTKTDLDDHLIPLFNKLINFVIIIIALAIIADKFNYNLGSLIAGLGLGGLAFALAAQDFLGNMFGGLAILFDKPFKIGDRIKIDDIDGFVKEIGLRSLKIRTFDDTLITVPNSKVVNTKVENISREKARRMKLILGLEYDTTPNLLKKAKKILREIIINDPDTINEPVISFINFGASSLDIQVIYWIKKESLNNYFEIIDRINIKILDKFNKAKLSFAYPTQTIFLRK